MGIASRLGFARQVLVAESAVIPAVSGDVAQVADLPVGVAQAFGINTDLDTVTRKEAMTIPAVRQGRNMIAGKIGTAPLVCTRTRNGNSPERVERPFFRQPDPNRTLASVITWTVDDLLFGGWALWLILDRDAQGFPAHAARVEQHRVSVDKSNGRILIDGKPVEPQDVIVFEGPDEGILRHGARTLRTALMLEEAVRNYARLDVPLGLIQDELGSMLEDEINEFLTSWETHRKTRTTGYLPNGLKYINPNFNPQQIELGAARGFQAAEIARLLNLPASRINAPVNDSLTYSTTEGDRRELVDITYAPFVAALEQRLSMGDVTPLGTAVHLDFSAFIRGDLKSVIEAGTAAINAGLMTVDEVRAEWLNRGPLPSTAPTPQESSDGNAA